MRDVIHPINVWQEEGAAVAVATVIATWGSAPRRIGAKMAFTASGQIAGSVSGGCVEGAVFDAGLEVLNTGLPQQIHFGVTDDIAWNVGLACGGSIEVFVERADHALYQIIQDLIDNDEEFSIMTVIDGPTPWLGSKIVTQRGGRIFGQTDPTVERTLAVEARSNIAGGSVQRRVLEIGDEASTAVELFVEKFQAAPTMVIVGGVHIAIALAAMAKSLGFQTIVVDPRKAFGNRERFSQVDQLIQAWPNEAFKEIELSSSTAFVVLTHDPKIDDPALINALSTPAFYVGALGSRKTHEVRRKRLVDVGVPEAKVNQIRAPIGLDIGAQSPEEIAVSIMAEIVAAIRVR
jgi:xanthine dehydrogenase accessory factor